MTGPVFLVDSLAAVGPGSRVPLTGPEGRHAVVVRRIAVGEVVVLADGEGQGVRGPVVAVGRSDLVVEVAEVLTETVRPRRYVAVQALAKGDRSELAVEMLTEVGVDEIVPWAAARSVVRWTGERGDKGLARWRSTVREAAKQSRRLRVPEVGAALSTRALAERIATVELAVVLHESATRPLAGLVQPAAGTVLLVVGPEGGITDDELSTFRAAGAVAVTLGDTVLRTSTAGVAALSALRVLP